MKKLFTLSLLALISVQFSFAQEAGFYPPEGSTYNADSTIVTLPDARVSYMYNETISFYASDSISIDMGGESFELPFISAIISDVITPEGMTYDCNIENCVFPSNNWGEVSLSGIPTTEVDSFALDITAIVTINAAPLGLPMDITFPIPYDGSNALLNIALGDDYSAINSFMPTFILKVTPEIETNTVVDVIVGSPDHTTLAAAVVAAGLVETLSGDGPFTVFAPTDAAFALLPEGTVEDLLADPTGALTSILTHHVYGGTALSTDLSDGMMVTTLAGTSLTVSITDDGVYIDNAMVTVANIETDNGVVHVIDAVLLPANLSIDEFLNVENGQYLYSIDVLGKRIKRTTLNRIIFDIYSSGNVVKRFSNK